jgi:4-amino-4-deoxy-L-arabinose transferase-like glycosyltransferase
MDDSTRAPRWLFAATLLLILLVAAGLRLYRLPDLPLGFHYDEAANAILAGEIASGVKLPIFIPSYTGKEVLFFYWAALWMKLLGTTPWVLRLSAALAGVMTVAATYWAIREMLHEHRGSKWVALLTSALLATSFWHLILSRYGFRAVTQPLMQALTVAALWRGLRLDKKGSPWLLMAGFFCGLTAYTYLAARAFPIPLAAAFLALLLTGRDRRRARIGQMVLFTAVAALTLTPLAYYWWTHPGSFMTRTEQVAATGWNEAWDGILDCLGMFFIKGDPYIRFNIPFRPILDPVTAVLFILGIGAVILQARKKVRDSSAAPLHLASCIFFLISLPIMLLPSALAAGEITPSNLRTAGLLPFVYMFPALALWLILNALYRFLKSKWETAKLSLLLPASCFMLLAALGFDTAFSYFGDWAISPALYYEADGDLADAAAYLNRADLTATTAYVASIHYAPPTLALFAEDYDDIRRLTGGHTVVFPAEGKGLLIYPRSASDDLAWVESALPDDALVDAPLGPDGAPAFHVYHTSSDAASIPPDPVDANFSHTVQLLGYDMIEQPHSAERARPRRLSPHRAPRRSLGKRLGRDTALSLHLQRVEARRDRRGSPLDPHRAGYAARGLHHPLRLLLRERRPTAGRARRCRAIRRHLRRAARAPGARCQSGRPRRPRHSRSSEHSNRRRDPARGQPGYANRSPWRAAVPDALLANGGNRDT